MSRKRQQSWRGIRPDPGLRPAPADVECHHGHVTSTTSRDGQLVRCMECQALGEATWLIVHREGAYS